MTLLLFRQGSLYFRELAVNEIERPNSLHDEEDPTHQELLLALQSARTRLAIAIAAETKSTPVEKWRYYLETADRVRCFIRQFRSADSGSMPDRQNCSRALYALKRLCVQNGKASHLCQVLHEVLAQLKSVSNM